MGEQRHVVKNKIWIIEHKAILPPKLSKKFRNSIWVDKESKCAHVTTVYQIPQHFACLAFQRHNNNFAFKRHNITSTSTSLLFVFYAEREFLWLQISVGGETQENFSNPKGPKKELQSINIKYKV